MTTSDNTGLIKVVSTSTAPQEDATGRVREKIERIQEMDRWRAEMTVTVPIELCQVTVQSAEGHRFTAEIESSSTRWTTTFDYEGLEHFAKSLDRAFPIEAGKGAKRILPKLRVESSILRKRRVSLVAAQAYFNELLETPTYIKQSKLTIDFLLSHQNDAHSSGPSSVSEGKSTLSLVKRKVKVKIGDEMAMLHLVELTMTEFHEKLALKFTGESTGPFLYVDHEGDRITVADDEDLQVALSFYPGVLELTT